ncbi:GyrI-like domain-containing protein [Tenggerimyces flavus]|uniref:GyrI-like domain-containing protein n=1 Tax=Tenggerimyces flavus TaxID=1708749 RepID=A0ABV7Y8G0_9ACTN|nr:GyrI-like domain-containing protein [Tenggerimyces flavus]MBM7785548.1 effector-binding domain-containing protein [Tenggerimyces flavus]
MELLEPPRVVDRARVDCLGIRVVTPFRGMLRVRDELLAELAACLKTHDLEPDGPFFHRLHLIDMDGPMDIEVGVVTSAPVGGDDRVRRTELPAGRYATLTYRLHARRANKALLDWAAEQGLALDRWDVAEGDRFACRYEAYRTDPRTEPRKTQWIAELNFRLADG